MRTTANTKVAERPGQVVALRGIVFQCDAASRMSALFIRPFEILDRWAAGMRPAPDGRRLANHVGIHVVLDDGREYVAEQLVGSLERDVISGLTWTPIDRFRARDNGGWDATIPAESFRGIDRSVVEETVRRLNAIEGRPFAGEDCTQFVERAFGGRRLFADAPVLRRLGIGLRVGDPALPLLRPEARLDQRVEVRLRADAARALPDPLASPDAPNARLRAARALRIVGAATGVAALGLLWRRAAGSSSD